MTTLREELQSLDHDQEVTMFELSDFNEDNPDEIFYFSNCEAVTFNSIFYLPIACEISGLSMSAEGAPPRPKLTVSDADPTDSKLITSLIAFHGGLEGATVTIRKTLRRFLDYEIDADPTQEKPRDIFVISHKVQEVPGRFVEFELSSPIDFVDEVLPGRPAIRLCPVIYRGAECTYTGTAMFTVNDEPTLITKKDVCGKTVNSCQKRFGKANPIPHAGFPGIQRV